MQQLFLIALGGSLGAVARYGVSTFIYHATSETFPWGTMVINLTGSFLIGVFIELFDMAIIPSEWRSFITIGFLGAFTTFSTYTLETVNLLRDGEMGLATLNALASNFVGIPIVMLGMYTTKVILKLFS
jgi:fluoride exporter